MVIIDALMPEMSGLETFVALRRINPAVVGIIASGFTRTKLKAESVGISGSVQKPFTIAQLCASVCEALLARPS